MMLARLETNQALMAMLVMATPSSPPSSVSAWCPRPDRSAQQPSRTAPTYTLPRSRSREPDQALDRPHYDP